MTFASVGTIEGTEHFTWTPWPRLPRKTKKLLEDNVDRKTGFTYLGRKEHRNDRRRMTHYMERKVK